MDKERKKDLLKLATLGLIILVAVLYFLWGAFLNRGTIRITAPPPFSVEVFEIERFECEASPCEITTKSGRQQLIFSKEGYQGGLKEVDVKLWRTVELEFDFLLEPLLKRADSLPEFEEIPEYDLVFDQEKDLQKLVSRKDQNQNALVYFQNEINPKNIYGSKNSVLIVAENDDVYRIDLIEKSRQKLSEFNHAITDGKWSGNGKYFVFNVLGSNSLWILDEDNEEMEFPLFTKVSQTAWTYENSLLIATNQGTQPQSRTGKRFNYVTILAELIPEYSFIYYHPDEQAFTKLDTFSEITQAPKNIIPTSNGIDIYFQSGEEIYKIALQELK